MTMSYTEPARVSRLTAALPFWLSLSSVPLAALGAWYGGAFAFLLPIWAWGAFSVLDAALGSDGGNADPATPDPDLRWYRAITLAWFPVQFALTFALIRWVAVTDHLAAWEELALFFGVGVIAGTIGITYAHELMHQKPKVERWMADLLMALALYGHFRSEHLLVHHRYVGTPRDPVSARPGEGFWSYLPRVLWSSLRSAWTAEAGLLARRGLPWWAARNPFWRYGALAAGMMALALALGGWWGLALFAFQAAVAVWQLELVDYIEHYGLTRKHLGEGRYEHVRPHHSWNAAQRASNWLLINLQRHSDHHYKPDRRFPLLQTYSEEEAPLLPAGYPVMTAAALVPPLWRRIMDPRVDAWRARHYPEVEDWGPYDRRETPMPR